MLRLYSDSAEDPVEGCAQTKWTVGSKDGNKDSSNNVDEIIPPRNNGHCFGKQSGSSLKGKT